MLTTSIVLHAVCALVYVCLVAIVLRGRPDRTAYALAASCLATAIWAAGVAAEAATFDLLPSDDLVLRVIDLVQQVVWYGFALHLYDRAVADGPAVAAPATARLFRRIGAIAILAVAISIAMTSPAAYRAGLGIDPLAFGIDPRLGLAVATLLLIENLYRNSSEDLRWHIVLPCVALGGVFVYDIVLYSDAALFRRTSPVLFEGRAIVVALVAPLLAVAAARNRRRWGRAPRRLPSSAPFVSAWPQTPSITASHQAIFYSASLVATGTFLLALGLTGEMLRGFFPGQSPGWGALLEVSLICAGVLAVAVVLTSGSARSSLRNLVIKNFLTQRYDYRREWLRCIDTLSQSTTHVALHVRAIKAVAQTVDSPAGMVFLRESAGAGALRWAGSWNLPPSEQVLASAHPTLGLFGDGSRVLQGAEVAELVSGTAGEPLGAEGAVWLAVPLTHQGGLLGFILLSPPRAAFALDQEVLDLLRILGQEVASYITQQLATEALLDARHLRDYGQRFAFVAHDIKNVASQLALLLANAEHHVTNPVFQRDMLATIGGSVQKINGLLARLKAPEDSSLPKASLPEALAPEAKMSVSHRLANLVATYRPGRRARLQFRQTQDEGRLDDDSPAEGWIMISQAAFESVITHLLDNAFDASTDQDTVRLVCQITSDTPGLDQNRHVLIDIIDQGVGMSADFIQQELFRPFRSSKADGFGIGVYQARELLRAAGGDLTVRSAPGVGTTMRIRLPLVSEASVRQTWPGEKATPVAEAAK